MRKKIIFGSVVLAGLACAVGVFLRMSDSQLETNDVVSGGVPVITHAETFTVPIDPNTNQERHKEVYEKISENSRYKVRYPTVVGNNFKLFSVEVVEGVETIVDGQTLYLGPSIVMYQNDKGDQLKIVQGYVNFEKITVLEEFQLAEDIRGVYWESGEQTYGVTVTDNSGVSEVYMVRIYGQHAQKDVLFDIARSLKSVIGE